MAADPYDADAVRAVFEELREADDSVNEATHEAMVELFATLSVEDRQHMARYSDTRAGRSPFLTPAPSGRAGRTR